MGFLTEFCCGCCITSSKPATNNDSQDPPRRSASNEQRHNTNSRRRSRHGGNSRTERGERSHSESRHSSRSKRHAPSPLRMSDRSSSSNLHVNLRREESSSSNRPNRYDNGDSHHSRTRDEHKNSSSNNMNFNRSVSVSSGRRDDASVMGASLSETYQGYLDENENDGEYHHDLAYLDEQSVIRRSCKDAHKRSGNGYADNSHKSSHKKTKLETHIEESQQKTRTNKSTSKLKAIEEDFENVTTISKASKNPYRVLGLSQGASPREIYESYKKRRKETHPNAVGGSDRAFDDVSNAYRRLYAELKRQQARKEQSTSANGGDKHHKDKKKSKSHKKHKHTKEDQDMSKRRQCIDDRLKDHHTLVSNLFTNDTRAKGISSNSSVTSQGIMTSHTKAIYNQSHALMSLNLVPIEAGATNINENNKAIQNNCFYLSLAASYLSGVGAFPTDPTSVYYTSTKDKKRRMSSDSSVATLDMEIAVLPVEEKKLTMALALQLKRAIEAAVLCVHPKWAEDGVVGEEIQAFSDFLVYALDSDSVLGHWSIAVFDEASGFVDVYRGRHYGKIYPPQKIKSKRSRDSKSNDRWRYHDCNEEIKRAHTLTLRYIPGHYQPLLPELTKIKMKGGDGVEVARPTLEDILRVLEDWKVLHVVTDGRA